MRSVAFLIVIGSLLVVQFGCGGGSNSSTSSVSPQPAPPPPLSSSSSAPMSQDPYAGQSPGAGMTGGPPGAPPGGPGGGMAMMAADPPDDSMDPATAGMGMGMGGPGGAGGGMAMMAADPPDDSMIDPGMDMGGMMGPGGPPGAPGQDPSAMMAQQMEMMQAFGPGGTPGGMDPQAMMGGQMAGMYGGGPGGPGMMGPGARQAGPKSFADLASVAFREGRDRDAMQFLYACVIVEADTASSTLDAYRWNPTRLKPALALRWGIGIDHSVNPANYKGDMHPIGTGKQNLERRSSSRSRGGQGGGGGGAGEPGMAGMDGGFGMGGMGGPGGTARGNSLLSQLTGEVGDRFLEHLQAHLSDREAYYGEILKNAQTETMARGGSRGGGGFAGQGMMAGMGGMAGMGPGMDMGMDPGMDMGMDPGMGMDMGMGMGPGVNPGMNMAGRGGAGRRGGGQGPPAHQQLMPGVVMLGRGEPRELLDKAEEEGLDLLAVFEVKVRSNDRTKLVNNDTMIQVYDVSSRESIAKTSKLNNIKVQLEQEKTNPKDLVQQELDELFADLDQQCKLVSMPQGLNRENVLDRLVRPMVMSLADNPQLRENPLPALAEFTYYHQKGLLSDDHTRIAYQQLLGELAGGALAGGSKQEKKQAIEDWLPAGHELLEFSSGSESEAGAESSTPAAESPEPADPDADAAEAGAGTAEATAAPVP